MWAWCCPRRSVGGRGGWGRAGVLEQPVPLTFPLTPHPTPPTPLQTFYNLNSGGDIFNVRPLVPGPPVGLL